MKVGKILLTVLVAGIFLLLLSTLVVSPEAEQAVAEPQALVGARLLPLSLPVSCAESMAAPRAPLFRDALLPMLLITLVLPALSVKRDANGRVLRAKRYENSFYQLFRQEVAGG